MSVYICTKRRSSRLVGQYQAKAKDFFIFFLSHKNVKAVQKNNDVRMNDKIYDVWIKRKPLTALQCPTE